MFHFQGGNPWYLNNFGAAEQLYDAIAQWTRQGEIDITPTSLPFFQDLGLGSPVNVGQHSASQPQSRFSEIIAAVRNYADELMMFPPKLCVNCGMESQQAGSMNEQFSRNDGKPMSAAALTWSNAAFITAMNRRDGILPASWGASSVG